MDLKELTNEELDKKIKEYEKAIKDIEKEQIKRRKEMVDSRIGKYYKIPHKDGVEFIKVISYSKDSFRGKGYYCHSVRIESWDDGTYGISFWYDFNQFFDIWKESSEEEYNTWFAIAIDRAKKVYSNEVKIND